MPDALYDYGDQVRVLRNVRNDGTFPGQPVGALLVRRGCIGYVRDVGVFLQDQVIYSVHFLDENRVVGCRENELQPAGIPWTDSVFEVREHVQTVKHLAVGGAIVAEAGSIGEVMHVDRMSAGELPVYHVAFGGDIFAVPENALAPCELMERR